MGTNTVVAFFENIDRFVGGCEWSLVGSSVTNLSMTSGKW